MQSKSDADTSPTAEAPNARREDRFLAEGKMILLMPWGGGQGFESRRVRLLDCSAHGLGLQDTVPMQPGEQFAVYVKLQDVTMVLYTVQHCTRLESGAYKSGAKLGGFIGAAGGPDLVLTSLLEQRLV